MSHPSRAAAEAVFATTHWSVVLAARDGKEPAVDAALAQLCRTYWPPLYAFLRRTGCAPHDAEDLVQGFFERLVAERFLESVAREKGRFRSFLLAALRHHVANVRRGERTQRRGGGAVALALDDPVVSERCEAALAVASDPESTFDRVWAETVLAAAAAALRREQEVGGRADRFDVMRRWLAAEARPGEYETAAPGLGMSEGALAVAVHRMRQRFRELVRAEVAHTVAGPGEVDDELRHLLRILGSG